MFFITAAFWSESAEEAMFEKLYRQFHADIYQRIYYILQNSEDVEDAMQETWLCVIKHIHKFHGKEDYLNRAYIMKIARNQAISVLRKKRKEMGILCEQEIAELLCLNENTVWTRLRRGKMQLMELLKKEE